jgi:hypothetical protein
MITVCRFVVTFFNLLYDECSKHDHLRNALVDIARPKSILFYGKLPCEFVLEDKSITLGLKNCEPQLWINVGIRECQLILQALESPR